jgi:hypothetical protein
MRNTQPRLEVRALSYIRGIKGVFREMSFLAGG